MSSFSQGAKIWVSSCTRVSKVEAGLKRNSSNITYRTRTFKDSPLIPHMYPLEACMTSNKHANVSDQHSPLCTRQFHRMLGHGRGRVRFASEARIRKNLASSQILQSNEILQNAENRLFFQNESNSSTLNEISWCPPISGMFFVCIYFFCWSNHDNHQQIAGNVGWKMIVGIKPRRMSLSRPGC